MAAAVIPNTKQRRARKRQPEAVGPARHELIYTYIAPFRRRAMKRARIERGQRVLHTGCGAGETEMRVGWAALAW
jgi:hypothetical protein